MQNLQLLKAQFVVLLLLAGAGSSKAAVESLEGTFGFTPFGEISYAGADLQHAVTVTLPSMELVNTVPVNFNGSPNDFFSGPAAITLGAQIAVTPLTLNLPAVSDSFSSVNYADFLDIPSSGTPGNHFDFDLLTLMKTSNGPTGLTLYGMGILHDSQGLFADTPGILSVAFTQTGQAGAVNASFSVSTTPVPEPGTLTAGCAAIAFLVMGGIRWSRRPTL